MLVQVILLLIWHSPLCMFTSFHAHTLVPWIVDPTCLSNPLSCFPTHSHSPLPLNHCPTCHPTRSCPSPSTTSKSGWSRWTKTCNSSTSKTHCRLNPGFWGAECVRSGHFQESWVHFQTNSDFQRYWRVCTRVPCPTATIWSTATTNHCYLKPTGVLFWCTPRFCPFGLGNVRPLRCCTIH